MKSNKPFVTITVPVMREDHYIVECVNSLINLNYPKEDYEIVVVLDKKATKKVKNALQMFKGKIKVLQSKKGGSAANRNLSISKALKKTKYFAFTDADCIAEKDWLKYLVEKIENSPKDVGCVGGVNLIPQSDNNLAKVIGTIEQTLLGGGGSSQSTIRSKEAEVPSIPNCNALYRKKLWIENKQDEKLITGQDGEFNYRLWKKGNRFIVIPNAIIWHHRTKSMKGFIRRMWKYGIATAKIFKKDKGILKARWYSLFPSAMVLGGLVLLILSIFSILALKILLFFAGIYLVLLILTTLQVILRSKKLFGLVTPFLVFLQHAAYGIGFIIEFF